MATQNETKNKRMSWSEEENTELTKAVNNRGDKSLSTVFAEFAAKYNRQPSSVTQHYYLMSKDSAKNNATHNKSNVPTKGPHPAQKKATDKNDADIHELVKKIKKMPNRAIVSLSYIVNNMNVQ